MKSAAIHSSQQADRVGKTGIVIHVEPTLAKNVKLIAALRGTSMKKYLIGLVEKDIAENHSEYFGSAMKEITRSLTTAASRSGTAHHMRAHAVPTRS